MSSQNIERFVCQVRIERFQKQHADDDDEVVFPSFCQAPHNPPNTSVFPYVKHLALVCENLNLSWFEGPDP